MFFSEEYYKYIDDDCNVITDILLHEEVLEFMQNGLKNENVTQWCEDNLDDLAYIYCKYYPINKSWKEAEKVMFFTQTIYERDDALEVVTKFVTRN